MIVPSRCQLWCWFPGVRESGGDGMTFPFQLFTVNFPLAGSVARGMLDTEVFLLRGLHLVCF